MDGLFDTRHQALGLVTGRRSAAAEVRTALLITLAVTVVVVGVVLALDAVGLTPAPALEYPDLQEMGLS